MRFYWDRLGNVALFCPGSLATSAAPARFSAIAEWKRLFSCRRTPDILSVCIHRASVLLTWVSERELET